jgi:hypothetical protein
MQGDYVYSVPILYHDVKEPDCLEVVLQSLKHLQSVQDAVFARIGDRVDEERTRLTNINHRVSSCQLKIQAISGSTKATTLFSSAKYPAEKDIKEFVPLFHDLPYDGLPPIDDDDERRFFPANYG